MRSRRVGGCGFPIAPATTASQAEIFWTPGIDPGTLIVQPSPALPDVSGPQIVIDGRNARSAPEGLYSHTVLGSLRFPVLYLGRTLAPAPLAAVLLVDELLPDRTQALTRFRSALWRGQAMPDPRLTSLRRRNLRQALQAVDGRETGATYQEIAEIVLGLERITSISWKSTPHRDTVIRRVREGKKLIDGAYRLLLRHRPPR